MLSGRRGRTGREADRQAGRQADRAALSFPSSSESALSASRLTRPLALGFEMLPPLSIFSAYSTDRSNVSGLSAGRKRRVEEG